MPGCNGARTLPDDHNIMQYPQMLHENVDHFQISANNTQHSATPRNMSRQGGQTRATCCAQRCCDRLAGACGYAVGIWKRGFMSPARPFSSTCTNPSRKRILSKTLVKPEELKMPASRSFRVDRKHLENEVWLNDNHVISMPELSRNKNLKWRLMVCFLLSPQQKSRAHNQIIK